MVSEIIRCGVENAYSGLSWMADKGAKTFEYSGSKVMCLANEVSNNFLEMSTDAKYEIGTLTGASGIALYNVKKADRSFFIGGLLAGCAQIASQIYSNPANFNHRSQLRDNVLPAAVFTTLLGVVTTGLALGQLSDNIKNHRKTNGWNNVAAYLSCAVIVSEAIKLASKSNC